MRLVTLQSTEGPVAAVERDGQFFAITDGQGQRYRDVGELLRKAPDFVAAAKAAKDALPEGLPLLRPILEPEGIVCVGLNYRKHILEMGRQLPEVPTLFSKLPRALTHPGASITLPPGRNVDYEAELCVVIGKGGRNIPKESAWEAVAGLTLLNDVTMRDFQRRSLQWFAGKTYEASTPVGPALVTLDELDDLGDREISLRVNGVERQRAPLSDLVFDVPTLVADLSQIVTLRPGDLIATGTPGGVGDAMKPPQYLAPGDEVVISLPGIGELSCRFVEAS